MIKVITLTADAWDIGVYKTKDESIPENNRKYVYESSVLNEFLNDGWTIKDFKMIGYSTRTWTFILEKQHDIQTEYDRVDAYIVLNGHTIKLKNY